MQLQLVKSIASIQTYQPNDSLSLHIYHTTKQDLSKQNCQKKPHTV